MAVEGPEQVAETKIFVIDDDEAVRDSLRALLESAQLPVETYASGREFLDCQEDHPRGCIVLDLDLPNMSGLEVVETLTARGVKVPIIVITGRADKRAEQRSLRSGAMTLIEKPMSDRVLLQAIDEAMTTFGDEVLAAEAAKV